MKRVAQSQCGNKTLTKTVNAVWNICSHRCGNVNNYENAFSWAIDEKIYLQNSWIVKKWLAKNLNFPLNRLAKCLLGWGYAHPCVRASHCYHNTSWPIVDLMSNDDNCLMQPNGGPCMCVDSVNNQDIPSAIVSAATQMNF